MILYLNKIVKLSIFNYRYIDWIVIQIIFIQVYWWSENKIISNLNLITKYK